MNKNLRLIVVLLVLLVITILAGNRSAWAQKSSSLSEGIGAAPIAAHAENQSNVGTVEVPNCNDTQVIRDISLNICGQAVATDNSYNSNAKAYLSPRQGDFISKTINLEFTSGSFLLCFAATENVGYVYFSLPGSDTWSKLPTTFENGEACAIADTTGAYAYGK